MAFTAPDTVCIKPFPMHELDLELQPFSPSGWSIGRNAGVRRPAIDKTSDAGDREYLQRLDEARTRHRSDINAMELGDIACDDRLVDAWLTRDTSILGTVFADLIEERIESVARRAAE